MIKILKKTILMALAAIFIVISVAIVAIKYQTQPQVLVVADDTGHELQFFALPERIVMLDKGISQLLRQWQRTGLVTATAAELAASFPAAENLGPRLQVTALQVAATRPDLIIASATDSALADDLRASGYPVLVVAPHRLEHLVAWPQLLGSLTASEQQASQFLLQFERQLAEFAQTAAAEVSVKQSVLWFTDEQYTAAGAGTMENDLLELVSAANVMTMTTGYVIVEEEELFTEQLQSLSPDIIIAPQALLDIISTKLPLGLTEEELMRPQLVPLHLNDNPLSWANIFERAEWLQKNLQVKAEPSSDFEPQ